MRALSSSPTGPGWASLAPRWMTGSMCSRVPDAGKGMTTRRLGVALPRCSQCFVERCWTFWLPAMSDASPRQFSSKLQPWSIARGEGRRGAHAGSFDRPWLCSALAHRRRGDFTRRWRPSSNPPGPAFRSAGGVVVVTTRLNLVRFVDSVRRSGIWLPRRAASSPVTARPWYVGCAVVGG